MSMCVSLTCDYSAWVLNPSYHVHLVVPSAHGWAGLAWTQASTYVPVLLIEVLQAHPGKVSFSLQHSQLQQNFMLLFVFLQAGILSSFWALSAIRLSGVPCSRF